MQIKKHALLKKEEEIELATKLSNEEKKLMSLVISDETSLGLLIKVVSSFVSGELAESKFTKISGKSVSMKDVGGSDHIKEWSKKLLNALNAHAVTDNQDDIKDICKKINIHSYVIFSSVNEKNKKQVNSKAEIIRLRNKFVRSNLRLSASVASKYKYRGMRYDDLVQEGFLGLIRAVEKYDVESGFKFSTYATWWVRQSITRALAEQNRTVRLPVHITDTINKISYVKKSLSATLGRDPTPQEISDSTGIALNKVTHAEKHNQTTISSSDSFFWDNGSDNKTFSLEDVYVSDEPSVFEKVSKTQLDQVVEDALNILSPNEEKVIRLRYGIGVGNNMTLEEVSGIINLTKERVRQIQNNGLRKIRAKKDKLRIFYED